MHHASPSPRCIKRISASRCIIRASYGTSRVMHGHKSSARASQCIIRASYGASQGASHRSIFFFRRLRSSHLSHQPCLIRRAPQQLLVEPWDSTEYHVAQSWHPTGQMTFHQVGVGIQWKPPYSLDAACVCTEEGRGTGRVHPPQH